jgi:hypothetical protein
MRGDEHGDGGDQGARTQVPVKEEGDDNLGKVRENRVKLEAVHCTDLWKARMLSEGDGHGGGEKEGACPS